MKAVGSQKFFFSILGMPSSGSSIICRFFDSLENGICVSEPMHRIGRESLKFNFRGLPEIRQSEFDPRLFIQKYKNAVIESTYLVGGLKEVSLITPNGVNRWRFVLDNLDLFDMTIFVIRDPVRNIDSIMKKRWSFGNPSFEDVLKSYIYFLDLKKKTPGAITISYEHFCELKNDYVNSKLDQAFSISGELKLRPKTERNIIAGSQTAYIYDEIALGDKEICLDSKQINRIKEELYEGGNCFGDA